MIIIPCWLTGDATSNQLLQTRQTDFARTDLDKFKVLAAGLGCFGKPAFSNVSRVSARLKASFEMKSQLTFSLNKSGDQEGQAAEMDNANIGLINPAWLTQGVTFTSLFYLPWELSLSHGGMPSHPSGYPAWVTLQQGVAAKLDNVTNQIVVVNEVWPLGVNTSIFAVLLCRRTHRKAMPEIGHFRSPQVMMPNILVQSEAFFVNAWSIERWTFVFFFGGYYTIRYDEISSSPLSLPSRPQMARWLDGIGSIYFVAFVSPTDYCRFLDAWNFMEVGKIRDIWDFFFSGINLYRSHLLTIGGPLLGAHWW